MYISIAAILPNAGPDVEAAKHTACTAKSTA
jgi:hypothetical protein